MDDPSSAALRSTDALWNARRCSGLMLANVIALADVRRQLKLENRFSIPRVTGRYGF
jgi:hypothetical protein